jgi:hypothetical protein
MQVRVWGGHEDGISLVNMVVNWAGRVRFDEDAQWLHGDADESRIELNTPCVKAECVCKGLRDGAH